MTVGAGGGGSAGQQPKFEQNDPVELTALRQLKDFVGSSVSEDVARQALRAAKTTTGSFNVEFAVNWLLDRNFVFGPGSQQSVSAAGGTGAQKSSPSAPTDGARLSPRTLPKGSDLTAKGQTDGRQKNSSTSEDTELQKAIALSLSEQQPQAAQQQQQQTPLGLGGQISAEEQELSKVIEASIAESKKGASHDLRQSSLFFVDPANPHERERQGIWPVGLKNVGNTCWFSVVIQALFHLPIFRRRLLNYDLDAALRKCGPPPEAATSSSASPSSSTLPRELEFVVELRKLFALLLGSRRKYVDPSGAVDVLRKQDSLQLRNIGGLDSGQQDVSEFTHLLLEWLEEAFKLALPAIDNAGAAPAATATATATVSTPREAQEDAGAQKMEVDAVSSNDNAIEQLFYGTFVTESSVNFITTGSAESEDKNDNGASAGLDVKVIPTTKEERFSQYPLQVVGCETLHDSMETSLRPEESPDVEHWLERLPPVFLFELTRFRYNQMDKKPEKLHSQFRFPKVLYVDRYLRENKVAIQEKRGHVGRLRQQLNALKYELEKLENFRGSKMPLASVLALTLDFIGRGDNPQSVSCETEPMDGCEPVGGDAAGGFGVPQPFSRRATDVSDADLEIMDRHMSRWRAMVLQHVEELKRQITEVEGQIESVYCEPGFQQHPYVLHAVLVHEGQATLGHYWTFISDVKTQKWRKFNDVQVTEVAFDEVERDSFGEYQNTSAYCLMYVDVRRGDLFESIENVTEMQLVAGLPPDLQRLVSEDNVRFASELNEWDRRHAAATTPSAPAPSPTGTGPSAVQRNIAQTVINETELAALVEEHGRLSLRQVKSYVQEQLSPFLQGGSSSRSTPEALLEKLIEAKMATTKKDGDDFLIEVGYVSSGSIPKWHACIDARVDKPLPFYAYCWMRCGGGRRHGPYDETRVLRRIVLDYFANPNMIGPNNADVLTEVYQAAKRSISSFGILAPAELQVYARIYYDYQLYLETFVLLAHALDRLHSGFYVNAFQAIMCTKNYAERLSAQSFAAGGIDEDFVLACYKKIAMHLSEQTLKEILVSANDEDVVEKVKSMKTLLLPCLIELHHRYNDTETLEAIRAGWLAAVLDEQETLPRSKSHELNDFLEALMEVEASVSSDRCKPAMNAKIKLQADIGLRFSIALKRAREFGMLQCHHATADGEAQATGSTPAASKQ